MKCRVNNKECSNCGVCSFVCPKNCIVFEKDEMSNVVAFKDTDLCINCGFCSRVCHIYNDNNKNKTLKCFVCWSKNKSERLSSASGGVAVELYKYCLENDYLVAGVDNTLDYVLTNNKNKIINFKNSKYVESNLKTVIKEVETFIKNGKKLLFIGLPCQVSALKNYLNFKKINIENIIFIDLICHGVAPVEYFENHLKYISTKYKKNIDFYSFRDPNFETKRYYFTCYSNGKYFYKRSVFSLDTYQMGYHGGVIYRKNCYDCNYCNIDRVSDITLGDFSGLGTVAPFAYSKNNVSCVLCNTKKGLDTILKLSERRIFTQERPLEEAFKEERFLFPTPISKERNKFEFYYKSSLDFERSLRKTLTRKRRDVLLSYLFGIRFLKWVKYKARKVGKKNG